MKKITYRLNEKCEVSLTLYLQEALFTPRPLLLVLPGGGYQECSGAEGSPVALKFFDEGYHTAVLNYSVGKYKNFEQALNEVNESFEIINQLAESYRIDCDKLGLIGFSAGGHLAASYAVLGNQELFYCLLGYPVIDKKLADKLGIEAPDLLNNLPEKLPNLFLFTTYEDTLLPLENFLNFIQRLNEKNVVFESHIFQKGKHGLALGTSADNGMSEPQYAKWVDLAVTWLSQQQETREKSAVYEQWTLGELFEEAATKQLLIQTIPQLEKQDIWSQVKTIRLKNLRYFFPELVEITIWENLLAQLKK